MNSETLMPRYDVCRIYQRDRDSDERVVLHLRDKKLTLTASGYKRFLEIEDVLKSNLCLSDDASSRWNDDLRRFEQAGLMYDHARIPGCLSGEEFYRDYFSVILSRWIDYAFSHPFWERMMNGMGSQRLYVGWLFELYHYTKNANRHMPLSVAHCDFKPVKTALARHYAEEWNHYHFFSSALEPLGYDKSTVESSQPLPMTWEMSNFMRQAAKADFLAYAICSAVLEGTTVEENAYNPFYEAVQEHYGVPAASVKPIYDHLDLDKKYQHYDLFQDICHSISSLSAERAAVVLSYGYQMAEHIWMWTDNIERYYGDHSHPVPRRPFDIRID